MVRSLVTSNWASRSERMLRTVTLTGATEAANVGSVVRSSKSARRSRIASSWSAKLQGGAFAAGFAATLAEVSAVAAGRRATAGAGDRAAAAGNAGPKAVAQFKVLSGLIQALRCAPAIRT